MAQAAVSFCGSLTCFIEQPAGSCGGSVRARPGLHPLMWAPTHGPLPMLPVGGWEKGPQTTQAWSQCLVSGRLPGGAIHFSCLIRIFYLFQGWGAGGSGEESGSGSPFARSHLWCVCVHARSRCTLFPPTKQWLAFQPLHVWSHLAHL